MLSHRLSTNGRASGSTPMQTRSPCPAIAAPQRQRMSAPVLALLLVVVVISAAVPAWAQTTLKSLVATRGTIVVGDVMFTNFRTPKQLPSTFVDSIPNDGNDVAVSGLVTPAGRFGIVFTPIDPATGAATPFFIDAANGPVNTGASGILRNMTFDVVVTNPRLALHTIDRAFGPGTTPNGATEAFNFIYYFDPTLLNQLCACFIAVDQLIGGQLISGVPAGPIALPGGDRSGLRIGSEWGLASGPWGGIRQGTARLDYMSMSFDLAQVEPNASPADIASLFDDAVYLTSPASAGGTTVALASSDTSVLVVPPSVTVAQGASYASFPKSPQVVALPVYATVTGTLNATTKSALSAVYPGDAPPPPPDSPLTVSVVGKGSVTSSDKAINCGLACSFTYNAGTVVTLTARVGTGSAFLGWSGACTGTSLICSVTANGATNVAAAFSAVSGGGGGGTTSFTLSIGRSNSGTVTGTPAGDKTINCGSVCSAKFSAGTTVTLTALPPAGKTLASWGGACSGTAPTCTVTVTKDLSVQANFNR